ncbi:PAS domain-containing sensor histidine kinase [Rhodanobacter sp. Si-c]|uniref:histidine kinase n=1 Tax=Rhodanobacter lycopersici TaxID=3162487 RepID=A0ABV3QEY2_9GAMM
MNRGPSRFSFILFRIHAGQVMNIPAAKLTDITFHLMVESSPSAVLLVNNDGRIAYVNRQSEILFGYSGPELIGQFVEMLIPERYRAGHPALRTGYGKAPTLRAMGAGRELFALHKDGSEFPVEIGLNPLVLVDGIWVLATVVDISERKHSEDRFRQVVQSAPNAMLLIDRKGLITLANRQAAVLFGYTEHELVGAQMEMLIPERFRPQHGGLRDGFFAHPQTRYMGSGQDLVGLRKDGTEMPIEVGLNPIHTKDDLMVLASIVDISERKAQEELRAKKEAAEAAYRAKGELLAIASHDLKNPLSSIAGLAQIMLDMKMGEPGASEQDIEFLKSIHEASSHMFEVVKGILNNEGLEQQGLTITGKNVDLSALATDLAQFACPSAARKSIELVAVITPNIGFLGDKTRLREAFDNYISNAIKYSPSGKTITVSLTFSADGRWIEFGVRDQGPGLTDEDKSKLFGKFKKLSARPTGGESSTGLGLSIVKAIIELHGGHVGCDSTPGQGAYFWAQLPVLAAGPPAIPVA